MNRLRERFVKYFRDRFDVKEQIWEPFRLIVGKQSIRILSRSVPETVRLQVEMQGFRVARLTTDQFKPTTRGIQWLGDRIRRHRLDLNGRQLGRILERVEVHLETLPRTGSLQRGYVALFFRHWPVGCGFWTGERLRTQLPKSLDRTFPREELQG